MLTHWIWFAHRPGLSDRAKAELLEYFRDPEDVFFAATGITNGDLLQGVSYFKDGARTDSLVMRGLTGTVREINSTHRLEKLAKISPIHY